MSKVAGQPRPPRLRGTLAWTVAVIAALPVAVGLLWLVGNVSAGVGRGASRVHVNWPHVGYGALTLVALSAVVAGVHQVRTLHYRRANYRQAVKELSR